MSMQETLSFETHGRGTYEITESIERVTNLARVGTGICHVFVHHTSASLLICENADPTVRRDLEAFLARLVPDGDPLFEHDAEGPDDMPAHIRTVLMQTSLAIPIIDGRLALGTWQGIYLWEHRHHGHHRRVTVTLQAV